MQGGVSNKLRIGSISWAQFTWETCSTPKLFSENTGIDNRNAEKSIESLPFDFALKWALGDLAALAEAV